MTLTEYLQERGRLTATARALNVSPSVVFRWARGRVPAERVEELATVTGIAAADLRPDLARAFASEAAS
jgi:DNA-binding transcriptional regulator YdaS (Cro superfamily)